MKEAIITDVNGFMTDVDLVPIDAYGVTPIYEIPQPEPTEEEPEEPSEPEPILIGYRIAVPVPQPLFKPRFDIDAWEAAQSAYWASVEAYLAAMAAYDPESELSEPQPPASVDLPSYWIEGLTQEEIDAIVNAPATPSNEDRLRALEDVMTAMLGL